MATYYVKPFVAGGYGTYSGADLDNAWCLGPAMTLEADKAGGATADLFYLYPMDGTAVFLYAITAPGGVTLGQTYYLKRVSLGVYNLEESPGGGGIAITSAGSGTKVFIDGFGTIGSVTVGAATPGTLTFAGSDTAWFGGIANNQPVYVWSTGNLPKKADGNRLLANTVYYIYSTGANYNFKLRTSSGGAAIDMDDTDIGSGTCFISYINWNVLTGGDTVIFSGRFQDNYGSSTVNTLDLCIPVFRKGGSSGNPITYQGADSDCQFYSTYYHYTSGTLWTQHATVTNVWYRTIFNTQCLYERETTAETPLRMNLPPRYLSTSPTDNQLSLFQPGDFGVTSGNVVYVRPLAANDANPNNNKYYITYNSSVSDVIAVDNVTLKDLNFNSLGSRFCSAHNLTVDGCSWDVGSTAIHVSGECNNLEVKNCSVQNVADGIYTYIKPLGLAVGAFKSSESAYRTGISVHDNTFSNTVTRCGWAVSTDYHAMGFQDDSDVSVYNNTVYNFATGATFYSGGVTNGDISMYKNFARRIWRAFSAQNIIYIVPGNPTVIVSWDNKFTNGEGITIAGITQGDWTNLNGTWTVANKTTHTFTVAFDSSAYTDDYNPDTDAGTVKKTSDTNPISSHGWAWDCHGVNPTTVNYSIYSNIAVDCDSGGIRAGLTGNNGTHNIYNNTIYDVNIGIACGYNTASPLNVNFKNNIIHTLTDKGTGLPVCFVHAGGTGDPTNWTWTWNYNNYYPNADSGTPFYWVYGGAGSISYATWKGKTFAASVTPDVNSIITDPKFVNAGGTFALDTDFRLAPDSPCIDAGTDVGLTSDYEGNIIPS